MKWRWAIFQTARQFCEKRKRRKKGPIIYETGRERTNRSEKCNVIQIWSCILIASFSVHSFWFFFFAFRFDYIAPMTANAAINLMFNYYAKFNKIWKWLPITIIHSCTTVFKFQKFTFHWIRFDKLQTLNIRMHFEIRWAKHLLEA